MTYSITIPAVTHDEKCKQVLHNLLTSISWGKYNCPTIVCWDNASPADVEYFEKEFPFISSLRYTGEKNLNFTKNANRGLRYSHQVLKMGTFLVNQDVVLPVNAVLNKIINKGISTPEAQHVDGEVVGKFFQLNKMADPGCPCNKSGGITEGTPSTKFAAFCLWVSLEALDKIGYLDEGTFYSSFEDDDYVLRANLAKLPCEVYNVKVHHELKDRDKQISTTNSYTVDDLGISMQRFMKKWGIPPAVPHENFAQYVINKWQGYPDIKFT
jgi:hypothetical protein